MITQIGIGILETRKIIATNRTGAALVPGGAYALDIGRDQAESTDADSSLSNLTSITKKNARGVVAIADEAIADNASGYVIVRGRVWALVDGTIDVAVGDLLGVQVGSVNLAKNTSATACGFALAAQTTNAGTLTEIYFDGLGVTGNDSGILNISNATGSAIVENIAAETQFDQTALLPANSLKPGDVIHIRGYTQSPTATDSTNTLTIKVKFGAVSTTLVATGTTIVQSPSVDLAANGIFVFDIWLTVKTVGAAGTLRGSAIWAVGANATAGAVGAGACPATHTTDVAINTTVDLYFGATLTTSAQNAANEAYLEEISVRVFPA